MGKLIAAAVMGYDRTARLGMNHTTQSRRLITVKLSTVSECSRRRVTRTKGWRPIFILHNKEKRKSKLVLIVCSSFGCFRGLSSCWRLLACRTGVVCRAGLQWIFYLCFTWAIFYAQIRNEVWCDVQHFFTSPKHRTPPPNVNSAQEFSCPFAGKICYIGNMGFWIKGP